MATKLPQCTNCSKAGHYAYQCFAKAKTVPRVSKRPNQQGKQFNRWKQFREEVAIPYLDENFGHVCSCCGIDGKLDIDHIEGRGSHPELRYELTNLRYLCRRPCHFNRTINKPCIH